MGMDFTASTVSNSPTGYNSAKYIVTNIDWKNGGSDIYDDIQHSGGIKNIRVIRYADVLLFAAEAAFQTGDSVTALHYINLVRTRARNSGKTNLPANLATLTLDDIYNERSWELGSEGHRYFDLIRTGKAYETLNGLHINMLDTIKNFDSTKHYLFPIPLQDLLINKGALSQNPGYDTTQSNCNITINPLFEHDTILATVDTSKTKTLSLLLNVLWNNNFNIDNLIKIYLTPKFSVSCSKGKINNWHMDYQELDGYVKNFQFNSTFNYEYMYTSDSLKLPVFPFTDNIILHLNNFIKEFTDTITVIIKESKRPPDYDSLIMPTYAYFNDAGVHDKFNYSYSKFDNEILLDMLTDDAEKGSGYALNVNTNYNVLIARKWLKNKSLFFQDISLSLAAIKQADSTINQIEKYKKNFSAYNYNRLMGEAKFIRGYFTFYLAKLAGGYPQVIHNPNISLIDNFYISANTNPRDIYKDVENDLNDAIELLPTKNDFLTKFKISPNGRATKAAAQSLLAKVYMMETGFGFIAENDGWNNVYNITSEIINSGQYTLLPNYAMIFEPEGEFGSESVFEIYADNLNEFNKWGNISSFLCGPVYSFSVAANVAKISSGQGNDIPSTNLNHEFENGDPRRNNTIIEDSSIPYTYQYYIWSTGYYNRKVLTIEQPDSSGQISPNKNKRLIRYADVLLMNAEAAFHLGKDDTARMRVNQVRQRARNSGDPKGSIYGLYSYPPVNTNPATLPDVTASGQDLMEAIKHERRVELAMEGQRLWDLYRWGEYEDAIKTFVPADAVMTDITADSVISNFRQHLLNGVPSLVYILTGKTDIVINNAFTSQNNKLYLYPNPAKNELNIGNSTGDVSINIFDVTGKKLQSKTIKNAKVDVSSLQKGLYLIDLHDNNGTIFYKFIKE